MTIYRFLLAALLIGVVAACTSTTSSPSEAAEPTPTATPEPTAEETTSEAAIPSMDLPSSAPELEAILPDEIGGVAMSKFSMRGAEFMASGEDNQEFVEFLNRVGAQPDDVSVAFAFGMSADATSSASVFAFRVAGVSQDQLQEELQGSLEAEGSASGFTAADVAGKDVLVGETGEEMSGNAYLYSVGDIVFFIATPDEAAAEEALRGLP